MCLSTVLWHFKSGQQRSTRGSCHHPWSNVSYGTATNETITFQSFLQRKALHRKGQAAAEILKFLALLCTYYGDNVLLWRPPVDEVLKKYSVAVLQTGQLYLSQYPKLEVHPGEWRLYNNVKHHFYWPHRANRVHQTVKYCCSSIQKCFMPEAWREFQGFSAFAPLVFVAMDTLG